MSDKNWDLIIQNKSSLFRLDLHEVWRYRDLLRMYVKRDIITFYKQTILGPMWFFIQPIMTTIMFMFVFGGIAGISTDGVPQAVFYMAGLVCWNYFADCLTKCSDTFNANQQIFGKVYFPRLIVPFSIVISNMVKMGIQLVLFLVVYAYYFIVLGTFEINWTIVLFPVLLLMLASLGLGFGLVISSLTTKYRDLRFLITFGVQLWMYATPVIYPLSAAPEKYRDIIAFNPLTPIFETFKYATLGCGSLDWGGLLYSALFMLLTLAFSVVVFSRTERNFMDTV